MTYRGMGDVGTTEGLSHTCRRPHVRQHLQRQLRCQQSSLQQHSGRQSPQKPKLLLGEHTKVSLE